MTTTKSIYINHLHAAVEQYAAQNPQGEPVSVIASHIGTDGLAYGFAQSDSPTAIHAVEMMADHIEWSERLSGYITERDESILDIIDA
jgi:hypothetical protein